MRENGVVEGGLGGEQPIDALGIDALSIDALGADRVDNALQKEKGKAIPHTTAYHANAVHQADLIFLPHDKVGKKTFKYMYAKPSMQVVRCAISLTTGKVI